MEKHYYVTPYENGCIIERDGEGIISTHKDELVAIRRACDLATEHGGQVFVRRAQTGRCRPYEEPAPASTPEPVHLGWRDRFFQALNPLRFL